MENASSTETSEWRKVDYLAETRYTGGFLYFNIMIDLNFKGKHHFLLFVIPAIFTVNGYTSGRLHNIHSIATKAPGVYQCAIRLGRHQN